MSKQFDMPLSQNALDLVGKTRSNIFPWRGQFSPELIENIFDAYCEVGSVVLDPFCGSGTVLCEAGLYELEVIGIELNPAAYILSRTYELINLGPQKTDKVLDSFISKIRNAFPEPEILKDDTEIIFTHDDFASIISAIRDDAPKEEGFILDAFVILLDINSNPVTPIHIYSALHKVINAVRRFPHSKQRILAMLGDSRDMPIDDGVVDFVVTSPPYINVFNYHQNYRRSAESLGWDLLKIAKSEIGSNRANRGNRFITVTQYCLDMAQTLKELHRVTSDKGRMILVVGHESNVLGVPFYNSEIIAMLAKRSGLFDLALRQNRRFKNKFGKIIREDLLHLEKKYSSKSKEVGADVAKIVASEVLNQGLGSVPSKNRDLLVKAINSVQEAHGIPFYHSDGVRHYNNQHERIAAGE